MEHDEGTQELITLHAGMRKHFGVYLFPLLVLLGAVLTASGIGIASPADASHSAIAGMILEAAIAAFLAYRVITGKGWIAGWLLLALGVIELVTKLSSGGKFNPGWAAFHLAVLWSLASAAYDCYRIHLRQKQGFALPELY